MSIFKKTTALLLAATVILAGCGKKEEEPLVVVDSGEDTIDYELVPCVRDDVILTETIPCTYKKNMEQEVYFPVSGKYVDKVYVRVGDKVRKGDLLVELSSSDITDQIEDLEYRIARNELLKTYIPREQEIDEQTVWLNYLFGSGRSEDDAKRRDENLENIQKRVDSQNQGYDDTLEFDRLKLQSLKNEYASGRVFASFDGTVKYVADDLEGSTSNVETLVMTLVDDKEGYFETSNNEYADSFKEGGSYDLTVGYGSTRINFVITPQDMDKWEKKMYFAILDGDSEGLAADASGEIHPVIDQRTNVLSLPKNCVNRAGDEFYVYVVNDDGFRDVKFVTTGLFGDENVEILGGLQEGDTVIRR